MSFLSRIFGKKKPAESDSTLLKAEPDVSQHGSSEPVRHLVPRGNRDAESPPHADHSQHKLVITPSFEQALEHLRAGRHLFLTGKAGTGKSTLIRHYLDTTSRRTVVAAPTGIAALNVNGYTVHRLFSFPIGVTEEFVRSAQYRPGRFAQVLGQLDTLIIDEASMVRADLFDALSAALERFGPRPGQSFGGVQLVLVGDLYQLPPVVTEAESEWINENFSSPFFFSARSFDARTFPLVELDTVFRQLGDDRLVHLLNSVRDGSMLDEARAELNKRTDPEFEPSLSEFWLTLTATNKIAAARNRAMLERLHEPAQTFEAEITGDTAGFDYPADESLSIAPGAQVMMLTNEPSDEWVNGSLGKITAVSFQGDEPVVTVLLRDGRSVEVRRHIWEVTKPNVAGGTLVHEVIGTFEQLPMKLAWAITIHKSQGQTLDRVVVDLTGGTFANGQLYVALSRCKGLDGLILKRDVLPRDLKTDVRVRRYLATGAPGTSTIGRVYFSAVTVGTIGRQWRPRPVEIAVVTDEGDEATTVINPTSDLYEAWADFRISTRDVQLAPLLMEAWPALGSLIAGRVPIGIDIDAQLADIDFELKRNGVVEAMPLGVELPSSLLTSVESLALDAPSAIERARAIRDAAERLQRSGANLPETGTGFPQVSGRKGYLQARTAGPNGTNEPTGFVVGGDINADDNPAEVLGSMLRGAFARVPSPDQLVVDRLLAVEQYFGISVLPSGFDVTEQVTADSVLIPGARICFSGSVLSNIHGQMEKSELHELASERGLAPVDTMTKSKTDVLVVAERGSQSKKAQDAARWDKPVIDAEDFLTWAKQQQA
ncbi:AAA family ATPase [Bacillus subtilis]|nr:AAA family ATPase [Bacillus subtilis]